MPLNARRFLSAIPAMLLAVQSGGLAPVAAQSPGMPAGEGPRGTSQTGAERYDAVGYAGLEDSSTGGSAITASHASLPVGSFAEVTALDSGKTILVMIDGQQATRDRLIGLSPAALQLLGGDGAAVIGVRVRRTNPPGVDQAALREGRAAGERIDTPPVLLNALRKRLPALGRAAATSPRPVANTASPRRPAMPKPAASGSYFVQVAALSNRARATALADSLGGSVQATGSVFRVRIGPYVDPPSAQRARDGAAKRGYGDARIVRD